MFNLFFLTSIAKDNSFQNVEVEEIDLSENNKLTTVSDDYFYSSTFTVGTTFGVTSFLKYNITEMSEPELNTLDFSPKIHIGGLKGSYNVLFSNSFFAKRLGIFPRFGIDLDLRGYNLLYRFWTNSPFNFGKLCANFFIVIINGVKKMGKCMCKRCCTCDGKIGYNKLQLRILNRPELVFSTFFTFEPETSVFDKVRLIPQIGIGPSIVNLYRKTTGKLILSETDQRVVDDDLYKYRFDIAFSFKMILKVASTSDFLNAFHLEIGYNYNPLLVNVFLFNDKNAIVDGGLWNFFLSLNYARNMNIGLETVDFFNSKLETSIDKSILKETVFDREENKKDTIFLDCGIGIGQWVDISSDKDLKKSPCPMLQCSFMMPYFGKKIGNNHYLSFICVDVNEDLFTGTYHNYNHNIFFRLLNNLSVSYNFLTLLSDYKGVKFVHKLGVFVPFLTNMLGTFTDTGDSLSSYFFSREMIGLENIKDYENFNEGLINFFVGKFSYKFKFYVDLFRLFNVDFKIKTYFYFGGNTLIFNRRNDYAVNNNSFKYEFLKIESINLGISFKFI